MMPIVNGNGRNNDGDNHNADSHNTDNDDHCVPSRSRCFTAFINTKQSYRLRQSTKEDSMDIHPTKRKAEDTEQRKRKLLTFKEFIAINGSAPKLKPASKRKEETRKV